MSMSQNRRVLLRTEKLSRNFGALPAVRDVSLEVKEREIRAIIGPNGAGKTTFLDLITNRTTPTSGEVYFKDQRITGEKPYNLVRKGICKTFQVSKLFPALTVFENVKIACIQQAGHVYHMFPKQKGYLRDEVLQTLSYVGMEHLVDEIAGELSYGDQKRLEIAVTLAMRPELLLLDEPTAGVARQEGYAIMEMILKLAEELKMTLLFIEHDMNIVFNYAHRISVMNEGELIVTGTPDEIRGNEFVQRIYLGGAL